MTSTQSSELHQGQLNVATDDPSTANLQLACIGNCSFSALLDRRAQVVWSCFPRVDGDPIFCSLVKRNKLPGPSKTRFEEIILIYSNFFKRRRIQ